MVGVQQPLPSPCLGVPEGSQPCSGQMVLAPAPSSSVLADGWLLRVLKIQKKPHLFV